MTNELDKSVKENQIELLTVGRRLAAMSSVYTDNKVVRVSDEEQEFLCRALRDLKGLKVKKGEQNKDNKTVTKTRMSACYTCSRRQINNYKTKRIWGLNKIEFETKSPIAASLVLF